MINAPTLELINELSARLVYENASFSPALTKPLLSLAELITNEVRSIQNETITTR